MTVPHRFARRFLLLAIFGIAQTLIVGCADSQTDRPDITGPDTAGPDIAGPDKCPDDSAMAIDWPAKIGIGAWNQQRTW